MRELATILYKVHLLWTMVKGKTIVPLFTNSSYEVTIYHWIGCKCRKRLYIYLQGYPQGSLSPNGGSREVPSFPFLKHLLRSVYTQLPVFSSRIEWRKSGNLLWTMMVAGNIIIVHSPILLITSCRCYYIVLIWDTIVSPPFEAALLLLFLCLLKITVSKISLSYRKKSLTPFGENPKRGKAFLLWLFFEYRIIRHKKTAMHGKRLAVKTVLRRR